MKGTNTNTKLLHFTLRHFDHDRFTELVAEVTPVTASAFQRVKDNHIVDLPEFALVRLYPGITQSSSATEDAVTQDLAPLVGATVLCEMHDWTDDEHVRQQVYYSFMKLIDSKLFLDHRPLKDRHLPTT